MTSLISNPIFWVAAIGAGGYAYYKYQQMETTPAIAPITTSVTTTATNTYDDRKKQMGCDTKKTWTWKFWDSSLICKLRARL